MSLSESKAVLSKKVNGKTVLAFPVTKLEYIEDSAETLNSVGENDYIPVMDSADEGQMKKVKVSNLVSGITDGAKNAVLNSTEIQQISTNASNAQTAAQTAAQSASAAQAAASAVTSSAAPTAFNLAASAWTALGTARGEYAYTATINVSSVTSSDSADVSFGLESIDVCAEAGVAPVTETSAGKIHLFAKNAPSAATSGVYFIKKGAAS